MKITFALVGNQNSGKSTLFNQLTGSNQHVGNFPGVTVKKKEGRLIANPDVTVIDLPGIYSLSPYTSEEIVTRDLLLRDKPNAIINIIDATNIERSLYLSLQLMELNLPMIIALNMMDEIIISGSSIDIQKLEETLGVPVVPISANKNAGIEELVFRAIKLAEASTLPKRLDFCSGEVHRAIHTIAHLIEPKVRAKGLPLRFSATKLIEGDEPIAKELQLTDNEIDIIAHVTDDMEKALDTDREAALADMRYCYIEKLCSDTVHKVGETIAQARSHLIDKYLTHKYLSIPIFLLTLALVFWLTFNVIGATLSDCLEIIIGNFIDVADKVLADAGVSAPIHSLIIDGVFAGIGSVLSFLPLIVTLFFFLSMLEDTGYMARIAFVMDKLLRKIGLSGASFVPMLIGFGCSVPAIMATRTLASERDRKMTIILTPFMSCSAKLPIYGVFVAAFFPNNQVLIMLSLYLLGIFLAIFSGLLLKIFVYKGNPVPFVMELPAYRLPTAKNIVLHMWEKAKDFLYRAFTIIFLASIIIWLLQNFDLRFNMVENAEASMVASIGTFIAPFFSPLGFGDWRAATALITGLAAKEVVISTLSVLTGASLDESVAVTALGQIFTPLTAFSFLTFTLLYVPCVAAITAMYREINSFWQVVLIMLYEIGVAWLAAFGVYRIGLLLGFQ
ncbi:MAG: ferrous iron transport protein B [Negativicutes bacterium]|nr:ferrous iron transport protein B [Negativicutes bacterium]